MMNLVFLYVHVFHVKDVIYVCSHVRCYLCVPMLEMLSVCSHVRDVICVFPC